MKQILFVFCLLLSPLINVSIKMKKKSSSLANYSTSYSSYTQPGSNDAFSSGSSGSKVKWIQAALNYCINRGYFSATRLDVDGSYGPATVNAVKAFQRNYRLDVDGKFGPQSISKMKSILGLSGGSSSSSSSSSTSNLQISQRGLNLIKEFEGCRLTAYKDSAGVLTIGYGTTNSVSSIIGTSIYSGMTISQSTAEDWLRKTINARFAPLVNKYNSKYHWTQNEFDALVSFCYNIGSIDKLTNNGSRTKSQIADNMLLYVNAGGKRLQGLVNRRNKEVALFRS